MVARVLLRAPPERGAFGGRAQQAREGTRDLFNFLRLLGCHFHAGGLREFTELLGRGVVEPRSPDGRMTRKSALKHVAVNTLNTSPKPSARVTSGD